MPSNATSLPIAWKKLTHKKGRLLLSVAGIAFSVLIMFMQAGFFNGVNDSQANLPVVLDCDLVMLSRQRSNLNKGDRFNPVHLAQAAAYDEVAQVTPIYEGLLGVKSDGGLYKSMSVFAVRPRSGALKLPGVEPRHDGLSVGEAAIHDRLSRDIFGKVTPGSVLKLHDGNLHVVASTEMGPNLTRDGNLITGINTWFGLDSRTDLSLGLIRVRPGVDIQGLKERMNRNLPGEILVYTPEELRRREVAFTTFSTPSGSIFGLGLVVGFLIGVVICYQILFNEINDHMPQYATIMAIGFTDRFLVGIVFWESVLLSILGFVPGLLGGFVLYAQIQDQTRILMHMTLPRVTLVFLLTLLMCIMAGLLAVRKALRADPAEVF